MRFFMVMLTLLTLGGAGDAFAQATGANFNTPAGQFVPGQMILVQCGSIVNGQPLACPNGAATPLYVNCSNCSSLTPTGASSNPVNGTISVTNTFQSLLAQNSARKSCTFQNQGTHIMYVSVSGSPTLANSIQVPAQGFYYCSAPGNIVLTDALQVTGTSGDAFAGEWQ